MSYIYKNRINTKYYMRTFLSPHLVGFFFVILSFAIMRYWFILYTKKIMSHFCRLYFYVLSFSNLLIRPHQYMRLFCGFYITMYDNIILFLSNSIQKDVEPYIYIWINMYIHNMYKYVHHDIYIISSGVTEVTKE